MEEVQDRVAENRSVNEKAVLRRKKEELMKKEGK